MDGISQNMFINRLALERIKERIQPGKVVVLYGEGMMVPKDSDVDDLERIAAGLGEHLDRLTAEAEDMLSEG